MSDIDLTLKICDPTVPAFWAAQGFCRPARAQKIYGWLRML
jgi:hypothetical protein